MIDDPAKFDLKIVKVSIQKAILNCSLRGLNHSAKWLSELNFSLDVVVEPSEKVYIEPDAYGNEYDTYFLAKSYFDQKEYDRCASFTEQCTTPLCRFLYQYSVYLSSEKKKIHDMVDEWPNGKATPTLRSLCADLRADYLAWRLDCYQLFLYGAVLKKLDLEGEAIQVLVEAVNKEPLHWGAWLELAALIPDRAKLKSLLLPDHWIKQLFLAHTYLELQLNDEALEIYEQLQALGFGKSNYILAQTAIAFHNKRDIEKAITTFTELRRTDPLRLDNLDTFSNLLYVKEMKVELARLATTATEIDKYRAETCCIIGNFYSLRAEHQKSVLYFQKALRLNPQYLSAWTLLGHEFMEMKNTNAAIQSYRQAIEVNKRDYRAWYGLGQTYEIFKMNNFCLYYYKQAQQLRPNDSRMLMALGETYERLDKIKEALKCFWQARVVGDVEGNGIFKLAKLYEKIQSYDQALQAYKEYVKETQNTMSNDNKPDIIHAYKFLAQQYIKNNNLVAAQKYANGLLGIEDAVEDGRSFIRAIGVKLEQRGQGDDSVVMQVEDSMWRPRTLQIEGTSSIPRILTFSPSELDKPS